MSTQEFRVEEGTAADAEDFCRIYQIAFGPGPINQWMFPPSTCTFENERAWNITRFEKKLVSPGPGMKHFKVVHVPSGKTACFGRWTFPHNVTEEEKKAEEAEGPEGGEVDWPEGSNVEACKEFFGALESMQKKYIDPENMYVMGLLGTDPEFHRKGAATMLLKHVLDMADREGKKAYIEATKPGRPVYERLGWKVIDRITLSLDEEDVNSGKIKDEDREGQNWVMMRDPQPVRAV